MVKNILIALSLILSAGLTQAHAAVDFQVIANTSVAINEISKDELRQILLANKTSWPDGKKAIIVYLSEDADKADEITKDFIGMTTMQAKKHYLTKVFNGVLPAAPQWADSSGDAVNLVAKTPGSVALIANDTKVSNVKILKLK